MDDGRPASAIGAMFDLSGPDAALLEEACGAALVDIGIDGREFFARLNEGASLGAALGLSPAIEEQLYERAHRWFSVGRPERAEPLFRALCVASGADADYWVGLGVCLRLRDDAAGAALAFATAARLRPDWAVPAFHAAELALRAGDVEGAAAHLGRFGRLAGGETPDRMKAEARKLAQAVDFRRETAAMGTR
jgi:tetratricopeptide (TPR) repeat protein